MERKYFWAKFVLILPALMLFLVFTYYPFLSGLYYSFTLWDGVADPVYIGWTNYKDLLQDSSIIQAAKNTLYIVLACLLIGNPLSMAMAVALNLPFRSKGLLRTVFFLPSFMSLVVISISWGFILQYDGVLNALLSAVGLEQSVRDWFGSLDTALIGVIAVLLWQGTGFGAVIYLAGLQSISRDLYESAQIDGAGGWRRFVHITFPLLMPVITINTFIGLVGSLKLFDLPYILTNGGPGDATSTLGLLIYKFAFVFRNFGYATAAGILFMILIVIISYTQLKITRSREVEL